MRRWLPLLAIASAWLSDAGRAEDSKSTFLTRRGAQLLMAGEPFRAVGVNKHELLDEYVADLLGRGDAAASIAAARRSLDQLAPLGVNVIRVRGSQFWPAQIEKTYLGPAEARETFWRRYDLMLNDCAARGLKVVLTIGWTLGAWADLGHESLRQFACDPHSRSRRLFDAWVRDLVTRYKDNDTVLFWELTNEANNTVDLRPRKPRGVLRPLPVPGRPHEHLFHDPVVRDARNNWTADELAAFVRETAMLVKSIDPNHLVGTGFSRPRPSAWHLWLGSLRRAKKMDWTRDSEAEQMRMVWLLAPDPVDLVSFHYYLSPRKRRTPLGDIAVVKKAADAIGKPVYWGEAGVGGFPGSVYDHEAARTGLRRLLDAARVLDIPLVLLWTWDETGQPAHEPIIRPGRRPEVADMLRRAHAQARHLAAEQKKGVAPEDVRRLKALDQKFLDAARARRPE